jgi:class 3 adenylate cyclase
LESAAARSPIWRRGSALRKDGQILISRRVAIAVEDSATLEEVGDLSLKGLSQAVAVYNVVQ